MKTQRLTLAALAVAGLGFSLGNAAIIQITGNVTTATWTNTNEYVLNGVVNVNSGNTLTIAAGTIIRGQPGDLDNSISPGTLVIRSGAKIVANGNAANPIIFTTAATGTGVAPDGWSEVESSSASNGTNDYWRIKATAYNPAAPVAFWDSNPRTAPKSPRFTGLCGGIVVLGNAVTNADSTTGNTAGVTLSGSSSPYTVNQASHARQLVEGLVDDPLNYFGGSDDNDNSGVLNYVSIRHGGASLSPNKEINGLSLAGIGSGTQVQNIEIWGNTDDGVEVWGGTVNIKNLVVVGARDDGFDIDHGWRGYAQFVFVIAGSQTDKLSEQDGDDFFNDSERYTSNREPKGTFRIYNATLMGNPLQATGASGSTRTITAGTAGISPALTSDLVINSNPFSTSAGRGIESRRGNAGSMFNSIVTNLVSTNNSWIASNTDNTTAFSNIFIPTGASATNSTGSVTQTKADNTQANQVKVVATVSTTNTTVGTWNTGGNTFITPVFASGSVTGDAKNVPYGHPVNINPLPAITGTVAAYPSGVSFLKTVNYRGAFNPAFTTLWTDGWSAASFYGVSGTYGVSL
jgi:hypothetical protein